MLDFCVGFLLFWVLFLFILWLFGHLGLADRKGSTFHHIEDWEEEPTMADSPRTDISTDVDTDDKNQRVFLLSLLLSLFCANLVLVSNLGTMGINWFCASSIRVV